MVPLTMKLPEDMDRSGNSDSEEEEEDEDEEEEGVVERVIRKWDEVVDGRGYDTGVLPMVDIREKWQEVAVDMILAMFCLLPGIGVLSCCLLFRKYFLARPQPRRQRREPPIDDHDELILDLFWRISRVGVWCILLVHPFFPLPTIWIQFQALRGGTLDLRSVLGFWELVLLKDAVWMGATLGWLILSSQRDQIVQSVCEHKKRNKQILMENEKKPENVRAGDLLGKLFLLFPEQFNEDIYKRDLMPPCSLQGRVLLASTAVMFLLMCAIHLLSGATNYIKLLCAWQKLQHHEQECKELTMELEIGPLGSFSVPNDYSWWFVSCFEIYCATCNWHRCIRVVLITTSVHMQQNCRQLLLFTALTRSEEWNSRWSEQNRAALLEIVLQKKELLYCWRIVEHDLKKNLRETIESIEDDQVAKKYELDLGQQEDVRAWWLLRQYIQIDFVDEVVVAECCGVIIMLLVFEFFLVAVMDWLQNHQISCALVLVSVLTLALLFAMFQLFQACVAMNTLWERDDHTLLDAIVTSAMQEAAQEGKGELKGLLESLQSKVSSSDARQELFGIRVTATLRNAWVLSLVIWFLSTLWEVAKPLMEEADLESMENVFANWTKAANYRIAQAGG